MFLVNHASPRPGFPDSKSRRCTLYSSYKGGNVFPTLVQCMGSSLRVVQVGESLPDLDTGRLDWASPRKHGKAMGLLKDGVCKAQDTAMPYLMSSLACGPVRPDLTIEYSFDLYIRRLVSFTVHRQQSSRFCLRCGTLLFA